MSEYSRIQPVSNILSSPNWYSSNTLRLPWKGCVSLINIPLRTGGPWCFLLSCLEHAHSHCSHDYCMCTSDGATRRMSPTSSPRSVSNENRFQFSVYRESKITYHIPDKQLKLSQKHKCGDFMRLNTVMSSCV